MRQSHGFPIYARIEVCGGIASGKTTLTGRLKQPNFAPIFENFQASPFLDAFYKDPGRYTFETEVSFLLLHYHQVKKDSGPGITNVCDFSMVQDLAYARMGLKGTKLQAFGAVYDEVKKDLGYPHLLVHLKCDAETELRRIRNRAREIEASITVEFLENLNSVIEQEVATVQADIDVISIDSTRIDFANDEQGEIEVLDIIRRATAQSRAS